MIDQDKLEAIRRQYEAMLLRMQKPQQAKVMNRLMNASEDQIRQELDKYYGSPERGKALAPQLKG